MSRLPTPDCQHRGWGRQCGWKPGEPGLHAGRARPEAGLEQTDERGWVVQCLVVFAAW